MIGCEKIADIDPCLIFQNMSVCTQKERIEKEDLKMESTAHSQTQKTK